MITLYLKIAFQPLLPGSLLNWNCGNYFPFLLLIHTPLQISHLNTILPLKYFFNPSHFILIAIILVWVPLRAPLDFYSDFPTGLPYHLPVLLQQHEISVFRPRALTCRMKSSTCHSSPFATGPLSASPHRRPSADLLPPAQAVKIPTTCPALHTQLPLLFALSLAGKLLHTFKTQFVNHFLGVIFLVVSFHPTIPVPCTYEGDDILYHPVMICERFFLPNNSVHI